MTNPPCWTGSESFHWSYPSVEGGPRLCHLLVSTFVTSQRKIRLCVEESNRIEVQIHGQNMNLQVNELLFNKKSGIEKLNRAKT